MTADANQLQHQLVTAQNPDGGWGYLPGTSWTEPTALAVLALAAYGGTAKAYARGREWLQQTQNKDAGWAPNPSIETSTWVTSLAVLALTEAGVQSPNLQGAVAWILEQANSESGAVTRFVLRAFGLPPPKLPGGSPWFPGTAAWIAPTVMSILALSRVVCLTSPDASQSLRAAIRRGQQYILSRKCRDGGWNHGGSSFRSENAESYPEMTGMALLALKGVPGPQLEAALTLAEDFLSRTQPTEAVSWLHLALMCHGRRLPGSEGALPCRTTRDVCLQLLALAGPASENRLLMQYLPD
jgi:hypothetical protein